MLPWALFCFVCLWGQRTLKGMEREVTIGIGAQIVSATWIWRGEHGGCRANQDFSPQDEIETGGTPGCPARGRGTLCPVVPIA